MRGKLIWVLLIVAFVLLPQVKAINKTCTIRLKLYDPNHIVVRTKECTYWNESSADVTCEMPFSECYKTGMYRLYTNDTEVGCSNTEDERDFAMCDATPPNMKETSPKLFGVDSSSDRANASWRLYDDGLILYYPFERTSATKVLDWTNYSNNANITGSLSYGDGFLVAGQAAIFDGTNDQLEVDSDLGDPSGMTIAMWVNTSSFGSKYLIDSRPLPSGDFWAIINYSSTNCPNAYQKNICFDDKAEINASYFNETNKWYHFAVVMNSTETILYINGQNVSTGAGEDPRLGPNMTFGGRYSNSNRFGGSLDEIMVFNRTLNRSEVINIYLSGLVEHGLYRAPDSMGDTAPYVPSVGMLDEFSSDSSANYTEKGDTTNVDWSWASGELTASVNEQSPPGGFSFLEYKYLNVSGRDILVEYDVKFTGIAKTGGINYSGVYCEINPNVTGWRDDDSVYNFSGINESGRWWHVKLYIYANRTGLVTTNLDVDKQNKFYNELINVSSYSSNTIGIVAPKYNDTMEIDNFEVTFLADNLKLNDTNATDNTNPNSPIISSVTSNSLGSLSVSWSGSDEGDSYYFYLTGWDNAGNPSNILQNTGFERGDTSYWTADGATIGTTQTTTHFGNYSLNVSTSGAWEGVYQNINNYDYYKGASLYWGCWAKAKTGTMDVVLGADSFTNANTSYTLSTTWQFIKHVGQVSSTATSLRPFIKTNETAGGEFYLDSCTLKALRTTTVTSGIKDYQLNRTYPSNSLIMDWSSSTNYDDTGLNCFQAYKYRTRARDNSLNIGGYSVESSSAYPIPSGTCDYGSGADGFCLDDTNNICYYANDPGGSCQGDSCYDPGYITGDSCYFDDNASNTVNRADDCGDRAAGFGCNVTYTDHPTCTTGDFTGTGANCWYGTNCYWNSTNPCSLDNGWAYTTGTTYCSAPDTKCCPDAGNYASGVNCTTTGVTGTSYDRDTSEAYCEESTATGCTAYVWTNISNACCGDDTTSDSFCDVGYGAGACYAGSWASNHCSDGNSNCGETSTDYGGPWCNDRPEVQNATLNASSANNYTVDNLTVYYTIRENDTDEVFPVLDWRLSGKSIMVLNMPFQINHTSNNVTKDFTSFENNGTVYGATWTKYGMVGGAYEFDGVNDYIDCGTDNSLNLTTMSITAWVKLNSYHSDTNIGQVIAGSYSSYKGYLFFLRGTGASLGFRLHNGTATCGNAVSAGSIDLGKWYFVAGTYNGSKIKIYINGVENATADCINPVGRAALILGKPSWADNYLNGSIDEVRIYNRSLSAEQITSLYNEEYNHHSKLVLNMPFAHNQSRTDTNGVKDWSQYENNGTLGGGNSAYAPVWTSSGQIGGVYEFDGVDDYIAVDKLYYGASDAISEITVCAWTKTSSSGYNIIGSWDRSEYWRFTIGDDALGTYGGYVGWDTHTIADGINDMKSNTTVNDGNWHFVCGNYDSLTGAKKIYIDGTLDAKNLSAHPAGEPLNSSITRYGFIGVGSEASTFDGTIGPANYFNGSIDDVKIFNASLSAQEILNLYREGLNQRRSTLVANETTEGDNLTAKVWISDNTLLSAGRTSNWLLVANSPPTITGITEAYDPIAGGAMQNITATNPDDDDEESLKMLCCNDTTNACTPSIASNLCDDETFSYPYTGMHCNYTVASLDTTLYVRCKLYDGTDNSSIVSTSFLVDSTAPSVNVINPGNYVRGTKRINATVSDSGAGLKDNSCKWAFYTSTPSWTVGNDDFANGDANGECYYDLDTTSYTDGTLYYVNWKANDTVNNEGTGSPQSAYVCNELDAQNCGEACEDLGYYYNGTGYHSFKFEAGTTADCCPDDAGEYFLNTTIAGSWYIACCDAATDCVDATGTCRGGNEGSTYNNCNDGTDNDCDGLIDYADPDCCPAIDGAVFVVKNSTGTNCTMVDTDGDMSIKGTLTESCSGSPGTQDFVVKTGAGSTVFWVNHSNCNACLAGTVYQAQSSITPGTNEFLVKNDTNYVLKIDTSGDLYLTGYLGSVCPS